VSYGSQFEYVINGDGVKFSASEEYCMFKLRVLMIEAILVWLTYAHLKVFLEEKRKIGLF